MTNHTGAWLTIRDAARELGVSELTVRRRLKDGRLESRLVDGKYLVLLAAPPDGRRPRTVGPDHSASAPAATTQRDYSGHISTNGSARPDSDLINLDALLADYRRLAEQAGKADALRQQIDSLEEQNRETREALVALANRNGWLESRLEEREHELKLLTDSRHRVSWWRRLFGATPGRETA